MFMNKLFLLVLLLSFFAASAVAQTSRWSGNYSYHEEDLDLDWSRTSYWFQLFVKESKDKLTGIYSEGINGEAKKRFRLSVKIKNKKARFYYENCLPQTENAAAPCLDDKFSKGDLMFELEEATETGKPVIYTIWRKINLAAQTETGKPGGRIIFFRKF
jgi:hypothetical protein